MRSFILVVSAFAIFAGPALVQGTPYVNSVSSAQVWASRRNFAREFVQYKANDDDGQIYYSCKRVDYDDDTPPDFVCYEQKCKAGLEFSDKTWGCTIVIDPAPEPLITEVITEEPGGYCYRRGNGQAGVYTQKYRKNPDNDYSYFWVVDGAEVLFDCPPGTYFNDKQDVDPIWWCQCILCPYDCLRGSDLIFTKDFKHPALEKGIYFNSKSVSLVDDGPDHGIVGQFDGISSSIEVPFFQNNDFNQFFLNISFKRDSGSGSGPQGLFYDGNRRNPPVDTPPLPVEDMAPPAIYVVSTSPTELVAGVCLDDGGAAGSYPVYQIPVSGLSAGVWNEVKLRFDGRSSPAVLELSVNGVIYSYTSSVIPAGSTVGNKFAALVGAGYDLQTYESQQFFAGRLDNIAFYRAAIPF